MPSFCEHLFTTKRAFHRETVPSGRRLTRKTHFDLITLAPDGGYTRTNVLLEISELCSVAAACSHCLAASDCIASWNVAGLSFSAAACAYSQGHGSSSNRQVSESDKADMGVILTSVCLFVCFRMFQRLELNTMLAVSFGLLNTVISACQVGQVYNLDEYDCRCV